MSDLIAELTVPRRFNGPPASGNGGWVAGALAEILLGDLLVDAARGHAASPAVEVSLRHPPPLDTPLHVSRTDAGLAASFGGAVIAGARAVDDALVPVDGVDPAQAHAARDGYPGLRSHPFPTCFACGPERAAGDGLRIFGGPLARGQGHLDPGPDPGSVTAPRLAATWTPDSSVATGGEPEPGEDAPRAGLATTWAALDCIGGWAGDLEERAMVLARITARVEALPVIGEEHVVVAALRGQEGRKTFTASTLHDADGRVVATAEHLWIAVDPSTFGPGTAG